MEPIREQTQNSEQTPAFKLLEDLFLAEARLRRFQSKETSDGVLYHRSASSQSDFCRVAEKLLLHVPEIIYEHGHDDSGNILHAVCDIGTKGMAEIVIKVLEEKGVMGSFLDELDERGRSPIGLAALRKDIALLELVASPFDSKWIDHVALVAEKGKAPQLEVLLRGRRHNSMEPPLPLGVYLLAARSDNCVPIWNLLVQFDQGRVRWPLVLKRALESRDLPATRRILASYPQQALGDQEELLKITKLAVKLSKGPKGHHYRDPTGRISMEIERLILYHMVQNLELSVLKVCWPGGTDSKEFGLGLDLQNPGDWKWFCRMVKTAAQEVESWQGKKHEGDATNNLGERASPARGTNNRRSFYNVEFHPYLKSVTIPDLDQFRNHECAAEVSHLFGNEVKHILQWLRLVKGVKEITKVRVLDSRHQPHSQEAIEQAISGLEIGELDWKRLDLSTRVVRNAAGVHTLHLYGSGSWTPIDHWVGKSGLELLAATVRRADLVLQDSVSGICRAQLQEQQKMISNSLSGEGWNPGQQTGAEHRQFWVQASPWTITRRAEMGEKPGLVPEGRETVIRLGRFVPWYQKIHRKEQGRPTRVAIIDSGIDLGEFQSARDVSGDTFCGGSWWLSAEQHGTQMAKMITSIDPCCKLWIAQVADDRTSITIEAVALHRAIEEEVDIISMSFALNETNDKLQNAINLAHSSDIVLLCSTADEGENRTRAWPASFRSTLAIAACNDAGEKLGSSTSAAQYYFRGENVLCESASGGIRKAGENGAGGDGGGSGEMISGSSVATAIAAGVASLCLACCEIDGIRLDVRGKDQKVRDLFDRAKEGKYVCPWMLFGETARGDQDYMFLPVTGESVTGEYY
ncbi:hypothetical protein C8A00DRAFT_17410 [Chaetomidium leptoderma]|uniref:Peptidase S8/S53 domain-containing protein n=1 Tax=Chaetomidium leptoderma TaxID=669021 RepID=A0AAN6ZUW1_9PEZI|nr:hypothetical protein C8A00DRAFT_17410 [Chaetomidium leptoderma]